MKPVYQTKFGEGEGNCLPACIASIFELPLEVIPHFCKIGGDDWQKELNKFLEPYHLYHIEMDIREKENEGFKDVVKGYHLINGKSPRGDFYHSIVGKDGKAIHDPHPKGYCKLDTIETFTIFIATLEVQSIYFQE